MWTHCQRYLNMNQYERGPTARPGTIHTLPTDQLFNLEFQFESIFNLEFQPKFGIQLGIPIPMGIDLGECRLR